MNSMGVTTTSFGDRNSLIAGSEHPVTRGFAIDAAVGPIKAGQLLIQVGNATTPPAIFGEEIPLVAKYVAQVPTANDVFFIAECDFDTTGFVAEPFYREGGYISGSFRAHSVTGYKTGIFAELKAQGITIVTTVPIAPGRGALAV
jgi:hypothetical protein